MKVMKTVLVALILTAGLSDATAQTAFRPPAQQAQRPSLGARIRNWWNTRGQRRELQRGDIQPPGNYINQGPPRIGPAPGTVQSPCPGCDQQRTSTFEVIDRDGTVRVARPGDPPWMILRVTDRCVNCGEQQHQAPIRDSANVLRERIAPPRDSVRERIEPPTSLRVEPVRPLDRAQTAGEIALPRLEGQCIGANCSAPNRRMGSWTATDRTHIVETAHGECTNCGSTIRVDRTADLRAPHGPIQTRISSDGPEADNTTAAGRASQGAYQNMMRSGERFSPPPQPPRLRQR